MPRLLRLVLLTCLALSVPGPLWGQATTIPAWQDNASVYLKASYPAETVPGEQASASSPQPESQRDTAVSRAIFEAPVVAEAPSGEEHNGRLLAPPSDESKSLASRRARSSTSLSFLPDFKLPVDSIYTMLTALALVVGLFLLSAWALRRGARSPSTLLPGEVVSVLGRVALAPRQFAHLLRVGNKLVLVTISPSGAETLAEVTDPAEVDRLLGICQQHDPRSTTREFETVFRELARQPADQFIERDAPLAQNLYQAYRGGVARG